MVDYDPEELTRRENARLIQTLVTPRPIAWVSTVSEAGVDNLAPFSSYNYVGAAKPVVVFNSPAESTGRLKDTARNALDTGEFAVNVVTADLLEEMDHTSKSIPAEESELDLAGLERAPCERIAPPRVADAAATMECTLYDSIEVYDKLMILGEVVHFHVSEDVTTDGEVDMREVETVGRLGGPYYTVSEPLEFERQF